MRKTTILLPEAVYKQARHRAIDERESLSGIITAALLHYFKTMPAKREKETK
jgi:hypothetical protein